MCLLDDVSRNRSSCTLCLGFCELVGRRMEHFKNQILEINAGILSMRRLAAREKIQIPLNCVKQMLFLSHPTYWNKCMITEFFTRVLLMNLSLQDLLKQSQSTLFCRTEMANIEQTQQIIPFVTCETSFGWDVGKLVFGVDVLDLDFWVQIDSIE